MAEEIPEITLSFADAGGPVVFAGETEIASVAELLAQMPALFTPGLATLCAQAVNHLAQEQTYIVIEDPAVFADWYKARRAAEDPEAAWTPGKLQLTNFDMPALDAITAPSIGAKGLEFYAVNRQIGAPYRVISELEATALAQLEYVPLETVNG